MSKKKILYTVGGIAFLVLGYFNYFADEGKIEDVKKIIETTNAVYESEGYYVEAEKEIDYVDEKESKFEKAKAKIKGLLLTGDNAFLDSARNLILNSNIVAISPKGWKINASELKYEKSSDSLISDKFVSIINEKKELEISGNYLRTNVSMDYVILDKGVTIKNKLYSLLAEKAVYDSKTREINLEGNIRVVGNSEENKEKISGSFNKVYYNIDERNTYISNGFSLSYEDVNLTGENIILNDFEESFLITKNVKLKIKDYIFDLDKIKKDKKSNFINLYGKITGGNKEYKLISDKAQYNIKNKEFKVLGNIKINSLNLKNLEELLADEIKYNADTKDIFIIGDKVRYTSKINNIIGKEFVYNKESKILKTKKEFFAKDNKEQSIEGTNLTYNTNTKDLKILNNFILKNNKYELKSKVLNYDSKTSLAEIPQDFEVKLKNENTRLIGKSLIYNKLTEELKSENPIKLHSKGTKISGKSLVYNNKTLFGKISGEIYIENKKDNIIGKAKEITFKKDDFVNLIGKVKIKKEGIDIATDTIKYLYKDKKFYATSIVKIENLAKAMTGEVEKLTYNPIKDELEGRNFKLKDSEKNIKADKINMYSKNNKVDLIGNVLLISNSNKLRTNKLSYNLKNNDIELKAKTKVFYENYIMDFASGLINEKTGEIFLNNAQIKTKKGEDFFADKIYGNFANGLIHFRENIKGKVLNNNGDINFKGEALDLYLDKNSKKNYSAKKVIITENSILSQLNKIIKSKNIEVDLEKNMIYSKDRPKLFIDNGTKGKTEIETDEVDVNLVTKIANLNGNIFVKNIGKRDNELNITKLRADRGVVKEKIIDIYDNIKVTDKNSIVTADEAHYYIDENKVKAKGNVHLEYKK